MMPIPTPESLGEAGAALWVSIVSMERGGAVLEFRPDELVVLETACRTADTIATLEAVMESAPPVVDGSRGQLTVHPVVVELRLQRAAIVALLRRLDVPDESNEWDGLTASQRGRKAVSARWS